jgi:hypothetical protein
LARKFTPSQQLRGALFVLYCEKEREEDFETFYKDQIGRAINRVHKVLERKGAMQLKIDGVTDVKTTDKGTSSKILCGTASYYVQEDATKYIGQTVEATTEAKTSSAGRAYNTAKILKVVGAAAASGNGRGISWADYEIMAKLAHSFAVSMEPDQDNNGLLIDRSQARAAMVNTIMIAYSNGKIYLPDEEIPF